MILNKINRFILIISLLFFSLIISSCGAEKKQEDKLKQISNSLDQSQPSYICNKQIYGDECNNLENFVLVRKDELKPEYIKAGSSVGGIEGTLLDLGSYSNCTSDGGVGCLTTETYKSLNVSNHSSKIVSTENIFGVSGDYVVPSRNEVYNGTTYGVGGSLVGNLPYCSSNASGCYLKTYGIDDNHLKAIDYDDLYSKRSHIKNGYTLVSGIIGSQVACSDGGDSCFIEGDGFKAVETEKLIASNIKHSVIMGSVTGSYTGGYVNCTADSHTGCIAVDGYPSVPAGLTSSLLASASINSVNGSIDNCSAGGSSCYINGSGFKAVEVEKLVAANIKNGVVIGGVTGGYPSESSPLVGNTATTDLVSSNFNSLMVSSSSFEWFDSAGNKYSKTGDSDIVAGNIRNGVDVFGVVGEYGDPLPTNKGVSAPWSFAFKKKDGTVVCFGDSRYGGDCSEVVGLENVVDIFSTDFAFAALKEDGSVVAWGDSYYGGEIPVEKVSALSSGVTNIVATEGAFAAYKEDSGSAVAWGASSSGGEIPAEKVSALSSGVIGVYSNQYAFAALKSNGSVVAWGASDSGGDTTTLYPSGSSLSSGVVRIYGLSMGFAAVKSDGSVVTWGNSSIDCTGVVGLEHVESVYSTTTGISPEAYAAITEGGAVVTWGNLSYGGDFTYSDGSTIAAPVGSLSSGVTKIFSTLEAFAALKSDGSVVTWGNSSSGGNSSSPVGGSLSSGVVNIFSTDYAFAALKSDGSVVTWGSSYYGGDFTYSYGSTTTAPVGSLSSGVVNIFSTWYVFAALKSDGSVVTWGASSSGGDTSSIITYTVSSSVSNLVNIFSADQLFMGVREDESYVIWGRYPDP